MIDRATPVEVRLAGGFQSSDQPLVDEALGQLRRRVDAMERDGAEVEVSIKHRESSGQKTTVEVWVPGLERLVATSDHPDVRTSLNEGCDRVLAQLDRSRERLEPRNNRQHRSTIRTGN